MPILVHKILHMTSSKTALKSCGDKEESCFVLKSVIKCWILPVSYIVFRFSKINKKYYTSWRIFGQLLYNDTECIGVTYICRCGCDRKPICSPSSLNLIHFNRLLITVLYTIIPRQLSQNVKSHFLDSLMTYFHVHVICGYFMCIIDYIHT